MALESWTFSEEVFFLFWACRNLELLTSTTQTFFACSTKLTGASIRKSIHRDVFISVNLSWMQTAHVSYLPLQGGVTALMAASQEGHELVSESLLKKRATVDMQTQVSCGSFVYFFWKLLPYSNNIKTRECLHTLVALHAHPSLFIG